MIIIEVLDESRKFTVGIIYVDLVLPLDSVREFRRDLFWSHPAREKMAGLSSGIYGGAGVVSLVKHRAFRRLTTYIEEHHIYFGLGG